MHELRCTVNDDLGLHARSIVQLASLVQTHKSSVNVVKGTKIVDASDVMALMSLEACKGDELIFQIKGSDEIPLARALIELGFLDICNN